MSHSQPTEIIRPSLTAPEIQDLTLHEVIGQGGMSTVYRGYQQVLDRAVAVKFLDAAVVGGAPAALERFRQEARLLASLQHPSIVACYTGGVAAGRGPYLVLELVEGPDLARFLREHGALKPTTALRIVRAVASGLQYAQQTAGMIHRDIKPENILLKPSTIDGSDPDFPYVAKLTDLGIAKANSLGAPDLNLTGAGNLIGTPMAMAPEQFTNPGNLDHRTDIYGLGYVLFWMLAGRSPFSQKTVRELMQAKGMEPPPNPSVATPNLPPAIADLCVRMLATRPEDRFATYAELITLLDTLIGDPRSTAQVAVNRASAPRRTAVIASLAVILSLGIVAAWFALNKSTRPAPKEPVASTPTAPAAAPLPTVVAAPANPVTAEPTWDEDGEALFGTTTDQRLEGWVVAARSGTWAADTASDGVLGTGPAEMKRTMPDGAWMIAGVIEPRDGRRVEIFVEFPDGTRQGIRAEVLGQNTLVRWTQRGEPVGDPVSVTGTTQLSVRLARVGDELRIEVGSEVQRSKIAGTGALGLAVAGGTAAYHDFILMVPVQ